MVAKILSAADCLRRQSNRFRLEKVKSTITIGLADALYNWQETYWCYPRTVPGTSDGYQGGAAGEVRLHAQVLPMEDINLHFTGDMHAITTANNALSALIDNHLHRGNELGVSTNVVLSGNGLWT